MQTVGIRGLANRGRGLAIAATTFALLAGAVATAGVGSAAASDPSGARAAQARLAQLAAVPTGWTGSVSGCAPGTESAGSLQATLDALNLLRGAAGLQPVTFDSTLNSNAMAGALIMRAQGELSHTPPSSWACYTETGATAAGHSNLYLGRTGAAAMLGYVLDDGVDSLGHRRWALDPAATVMGSGSTDDSNLLWVIGGGPTRDVVADGVVAWPPAGWVTADWIPAAWSVSVGDGKAAWTWVDGIPQPWPRVTGTPSVAMTLDGQTLPTIAAGSLPDGYGAGQGYTWTPQLGHTLDSGEHTLTVSVTGLQVRIADDPVAYQPLPISYTVQVTPPPADPAPSQPTDDETEQPAGATVTVAATRGASRLWVDVDPDGSSGRYRFVFQRQRSNGTWARVGTYRTRGGAHRRTINLRRGTYRVTVPAQAGYGQVVSSAVILVR